MYAIPWLPVQTLRVVLSASACQDTVEMAMNVQVRDRKKTFLFSMISNSVSNVQWLFLCDYCYVY